MKNERERDKEVVGMKKVKRKTVFIHKPTDYEISCDLCGGTNITWSEYNHLIWCYDCQKDTPGNGGIFDGPIPIHICEIMGLSFDKISLKTGKRLYEQIRGDKIIWTKKPPLPAPGK